MIKKHRKKLFLVLPLAVLAVIVIIFITNLDDAPHLKLADGTLTSSTYAIVTLKTPLLFSDSVDKLSVEITNLSDSDIFYDEVNQLEIKYDEDWYIIPNKLSAIQEVSYGISPGQSVHYDISLKEYFGVLDVGEYRIIKPIYGFDTKEYVIAEFLVE